MDRGPRVARRNPGYSCYDANGDGSRECYVGGTGSGPVGSACQFTWQCSGGGRGACVTEDNGLRDGYCVLRGCTAGGTGTTGCPSGSHCSVPTGETTGYCIDNCASNADCRADGYLCYDVDADSAKECWAAATGSGAVGAACSGSWDCAGGVNGFCAPAQEDGTFPGGYCMVDCSSASCPSGSTCITGGTTAVCLDNCSGTGMGNCRSGYTCTDTGTGTSVCYN